MKKTMLIGVAGAASLMLASVTSVQANAIITIKSGTGPGSWATSGVVAGNSVSLGTVATPVTVGAWTTTVNSGTSSFLAPDLTLGLAQSSSSSRVTAGVPLTVIYSTGSFSDVGAWTDVLQGTASSLGLNVTAQFYLTTSLDTGTNAPLTGLFSTLSGAFASGNTKPLLGAGVAGAGSFSTPNPYYFTEVLTITPTTTGALKSVQVNSTFDVASVPDGGSTMAILGGSILGLGFLRRQFSRKA